MVRRTETERNRQPLDANIHLFNEYSREISHPRAGSEGAGSDYPAPLISFSSTSLRRRDCCCKL